MKPSAGVLCISSDVQAGETLLQGLGIDLREDLEVATPHCLKRAMRRYRAVILDGYSLGERSIEVAKRLRWLGIIDPVVLAWECDTPLDRVIARECGVDEFISRACCTQLDTMLQDITKTGRDVRSAQFAGARQGKRQPGTGNPALRTNETASVQL